MPADPSWTDPLSAFKQCQLGGLQGNKGVWSMCSGKRLLLLLDVCLTTFTLWWLFLAIIDNYLCLSFWCKFICKAFYLPKTLSGYCKCYKKSNEPPCCSYTCDRDQLHTFWCSGAVLVLPAGSFLVFFWRFHLLSALLPISHRKHPAQKCVLCLHQK